MAAIVSFIGWHDCGKTSLAVDVVSHLKAMGYNVAVMKSSSETNIECDNPGTDTYKHKKAGADSVLLVAPDQIVLQSADTENSLQTMVHRFFPDADIVIAEGFKKTRKISKIEIAKDVDHKLRKEVSGVIAVATNVEGVAGDYIFHLDESLELAQFIEKRFILKEGKGKEIVSLLVNGQKVVLKDFIQRSLAGTVHGYVNSLKVSEDIEDIELTIKIKRM